MFREIKVKHGILPENVFERDARICFRQGCFSLMESKNDCDRGRETTTMYGQRTNMCSWPWCAQISHWLFSRRLWFHSWDEQLQCSWQVYSKNRQDKKKVLDYSCSCKKIENKKDEKLVVELYHIAETKARNIHEVHVCACATFITSLLTSCAKVLILFCIQTSTPSRSHNVNWIRYTKCTIVFKRAQFLSIFRATQANRHVLYWCRYQEGVWSIYEQTMWWMWCSQRKSRGKWCV